MMKFEEPCIATYSQDELVVETAFTGLANYPP